jgi:predicted RNA methylase
MHHLFCGGFEEILPTIGFVDAVISDPPYGITSAKCDVPFNLKRFWQLVETVKRQPGTPTVLFCNQPFTTDLITSNRAQFKYCWYWVKNTKTNFAVSHKMPLRQLEEIAVFYVPPPPFIIIFTWSSTLRKSKRISAKN